MTLKKEYVPLERLPIEDIKPRCSTHLWHVLTSPCNQRRFHLKTLGGFQETARKGLWRLKGCGQIAVCEGHQLLETLGLGIADPTGPDKKFLQMKRMSGAEDGSCIGQEPTSGSRAHSGDDAVLGARLV